MTAPQSYMDLGLDLPKYFHPLIIFVVYLASNLFSHLIWRGAPRIGTRQRSVMLHVLLFYNLSYIAEWPYNLWSPLARDLQAPLQARDHVLGTTLTWVAITIALLSTTSPARLPYAFLFVAEFLFQAAFCVAKGLSIRSAGPTGILSFIPSIARTIATLMVLAIIRHTDFLDEEEAAPLLQPSQDESSNRISFRRYSIFWPYLWTKQMTPWFAARVAIVILRRIANFAIPRQEGLLLDKFATSKEFHVKDIIWWISFQVVVLVCSHSESWVASKFESYSFPKLTTLAISHTLGLSWDHVLKESAGELVKAADQAQSLNKLIDSVCFGICPKLVDLVIATSYMGYKFGPHLVFIIIGLTLVYSWLGVASATWANSSRRVWQEESRTRNQIATECIAQYSTISYFNRAAFEVDRHLKAARATMSGFLEYTAKLYTLQATQGMLVLGAYLSAAVLILLRIKSRQNTLGTFVTFIRYWDSVTGPVRTVATSWLDITAMFVDAERFLQLLTKKSTINDPEPARDLVINSGQVRFDNVWFNYENRESVLQGVSFEAEAGRTVAFVGETGSGKSTIIHLLFRNSDVKKGIVKIDDQDVRSVTVHSLREALGIVPQTVSLFNKSIRENVRYGRLDATDKEIEDACKAAAIHDKIESFPDGYETLVGDGGILLSGGEKQRIGIARAVVKDPKILLLDEATSAMDTETESKIQATLQEISKDRTTFVVAHRLSTVINASKIIVLGHGGIIEQGTHDELISKGGRYKELWRLQTVQKFKAA